MVQECVVKLQKFATTWWVARVLKAKSEDNDDKLLLEPSSSAEESHHDLNVVTRQANPKISINVNIELLLKWIKGEISMSEDQEHRVEKVVFMVESEEDLIHMVALTDELYNIMAKKSSRKELKKQLLQQETFSSENPLWPDRWFIHIRWTNFDNIPCEMAKLHQVEVLDFSWPKGRSTYDATKITKLPHYIGVFKELKVLNVEYQGLCSLPSSLQLCTKLEELYLLANRFVALPGFLLNLPNLRRISRHSNCFYNFHNFHGGRIVAPTVNEEKASDTDKDEKMFHCDSLCKLAALKVVRSLDFYTVQDINMLDIPRTLRENIYDTFCDLNVCNHCGQLVNQKEALVYSILTESFLGYTNIPIRGVTCSNACAIAARQKILDLNESYVSQYYKQTCFDANLMLNTDETEDLPKENRRRKRNRFSRLLHRLSNIF